MTQVADELLTVREVGKTLRVDDTTVRRWIKNGVLEAVSLPHLGKRQSYRIRRETLSKITGDEKHTHHSHNHHGEAVAI